MKRKRENIFIPVTHDQSFGGGTHHGKKDPLVVERTSSGRTSTESVLSPQTSLEILKERSQLCQFFSPIPSKSFSSTSLTPHEETDSDESIHSDDQNHAIRRSPSTHSHCVNDYGYFTNPHVESRIDEQPPVFARTVSPLSRAHTGIASNNQTLVFPKPRKADTVYDFSALLKALPEDKDPADKKRIT